MMEMNVEQIIHLFTNAFGIYIVHCFLEMSLDRKQIFSKYFKLIYLVYWLVLSSKYLLDSMVAVNIVVNLLFIFIITSAYKNNLQRRMMAAVLIYIFAMVSEELTAFLLGVIHEKSLTSLFQEDSFKLLGNVSSKLVYFIMMKIADKMIGENSELEIPRMYWLCLFCIPLGSIFILYVIFSLNILYEYNNQNISLLFSVFLIIMINFLVFHLYDKILAEVRIKLQNAYLEQENEYYAKQHEETENMKAEVNSIRHDMKNQLIGMLGLLVDKDYYGLQIHLRRLLGGIEQIKGFMCSGNTVIDSILYHKIAYAKKEDISVELDFKIPEDIKVDSNKFSVILGSAMDNAIEACCKLDKQERKIWVSMGYERRTLSLEVSNPYQGKLEYDLHGNLISSKRQKQEHGIGLKNIKKIIEAEEDFMTIDDDNHIFKLKILLFDKNNAKDLMIG